LIAIVRKIRKFYSPLSESIKENNSVFESVFKMLLKILIPILVLSLVILVISDDSIQVMRYTMSQFMKNRAINLVQNGFSNQMDLSNIATNLTTDFDTQYGSEWFCIIGPIGYVAHFNFDRNTLLWFRINEIEVILYKPNQVLVHKIK
jgi:hypothetical protein